MPERTAVALSAIVSAGEGGVLFHCIGGRDRSGMIAMLLLLAAGTDPEEIVADYLETVRRGDVRAARANGNNDEAEIEALCRRHGTTTEGAFRAALKGVDLQHLLMAGGMSQPDRANLMSWRGSITRRMT